MVSLDGIQTISDIFQRHLPIYGLPFAALFDHGLCQSIRTIERFIAVAVAVGNPALIDFFIFKRNHTQNLMVFDLHDQIGTGGVVRTDGFASPQLPGTRLVAKWLAGQCTHRANVNHVAREFGVDGFTDKGFNLGVLTAVRHAQLHAAGYFLPKTNTARAMDTATHFFHADERSHIFVEHHTLFFVIA